MEYRVKYRDIPWGVALGVLPGKIIGTFFIKPSLKLSQNWKRTFKRCLSLLIGISLGLFLLALIGVLVESTTDGGISRMFSDAWIWWNDTVVADSNIVDLSTPVESTRNHH